MCGGLEAGACNPNLHIFLQIVNDLAGAADSARGAVPTMTFAKDVV